MSKQNSAAFFSLFQVPRPTKTQAVKVPKPPKPSQKQEHLHQGVALPHLGAFKFHWKATNFWKGVKL